MLSRKHTFSLLFVIAVIICVIIYLRYKILDINSMGSEKAISFVLGGNTIYSGRFSQANFNKIKKGMAAQNVESLLGRPSSVIKGPSSAFYHYTSMENDQTRWLKVVEIDYESSDVLSTYDGLYMDP